MKQRREQTNEGNTSDDWAVLWFPNWSKAYQNNIMEDDG